MEADDDGGVNENTSGVERSCALNIASVEWQCNAGDSASGIIVSATLLSKQTLDVDVALKRIPRVEADGDAGGSTFDLRISLDSVVDWDCDGGGH